jgi:hypothetical protein
VFFCPGRNGRNADRIASYAPADDRNLLSSSNSEALTARASVSGFNESSSVADDRKSIMLKM